MADVIVIGSGFAGLAAASHLAKGGARVQLVERHDQPGGRARTWSKDGFRFDMGPSWYWMPDVFERFFAAFDHEVGDLYDLVRLDPSYRVVWPTGQPWPVLFLGASARDTSAMYSLMSYADMALGTRYPMGGMHRIIEAMVRVAEAQGVEISLGEPATQILVDDGAVVGVQTESRTLRADAVVAAADYHHVEQTMLPAEYRQYSERYWSRRTMSPSSLLFYVGLDGDLGDLPHHTLFFDEDLDVHMHDVYTAPRWPDAPLFYACAPSVTDPSVAPEGSSNLFLLVPLAPGLEDRPEARERTWDHVMTRLERHVGSSVRDRIRVRRSYAMSDFVADYGAFRGNAYGLANTLSQTGPLKPRLRSSKVRGLHFAGQLTVPGPGMPPSLVSGELAARLVLEEVG